MKQNNQYIFKKSYAKPVIEEVMIDHEMSLFMITGGPPVDPDCPDCPIDDDPPPGSDAAIAPKYSSEYQTTSPFGGSRPVYD